MSERSSLEGRVIILAPSGRDSTLTQQLMASVGIDGSPVNSTSELFQEIEKGAGAVFIASEALSSLTVLHLARVLERQPAWSDLPILIISGTATGINRSSQLRELSVLTNATVLERPVRSATIVNSIKVALRARGRQYEMRDHLVERTRLEMQLAEAYHKQFRIAETLQRSMLNHPARGKFPHLQMETLYVAAKDEADVGGDFFDIFLVDSSTVAVVVGDVSGKGLEAAARSLEVKYPVRAFLRTDPSPGAALEYLNAYLLDAQDLDQAYNGGFVCMCIGIVDTTTHDFCWSSAGFEGPVLVQAQKFPEVFECCCPPVGVIRNQRYLETTLQMTRDQTVLLFTDGITESRNGRDFFGIEGVTKSLTESHALSPVDAVQTIARSASTFSGDVIGDDVCVVAFKIDD